MLKTQDDLIQLSPDGEWASVSLYEQDPPLEIRNEKGHLVFVVNGKEIDISKEGAKALVLALNCWIYRQDFKSLLPQFWDLFPGKKVLSPNDFVVEALYAFDLEEPDYNDWAFYCPANRCHYEHNAEDVNPITDLDAMTPYTIDGIFPFFRNKRSVCTKDHTTAAASIRALSMESVTLEMDPRCHETFGEAKEVTYEHLLRDWVWLDTKLPCGEIRKAR